MLFQMPVELTPAMREHVSGLLVSAETSLDAAAEDLNRALRHVTERKAQLMRMRTEGIDCRHVRACASCDLKWNGLLLRLSTSNVEVHLDRAQHSEEAAVKFIELMAE
jgi:hypothetical protein